MKKLLPSSALDNSFPRALHTLYCKKYDWLTRIGPSGKKGRILWIDIAGFNRWSECQGLDYRLDLNHPRAVAVEEGEVTA